MSALFQNMERTFSVVCIEWCVCMCVNGMLANESSPTKFITRVFVRKDKMPGRCGHNFEICEDNSLQECSDDGDTFGRSIEDNRGRECMQAETQFHFDILDKFWQQNGKV